MAAERPFWGWDEQGCREYIVAAAEDGRVSKELKYQHAYNKFLDMLAKHGAPGFIAVVIFFFVPLTLFSRYIKSGKPKHRALATAGTLLAVILLISA